MQIKKLKILHYLHSQIMNYLKNQLTIFNRTKTILILSHCRIHSIPFQKLCQKNFFLVWNLQYYMFHNWFTSLNHNMHEWVFSPLVFQILKLPSQPSCPPPEESDSSKLELYSTPVQETGDTQGKNELVPHNNINSMPGFTDDGDILVHHFNSIHETDLLEVFSWTDIVQKKSLLPPVLQPFSELMEANDLQLIS